MKNVGTLFVLLFGVFSFLLKCATASAANIIPFGVDFGEVATGTTATAKVKFLYQGDDFLAAQVSIVSDRENQFSIIRNSCNVLTPGSICSVRVQFKPSAPGRTRAFVQIVANDAVAMAELSGFGSAVPLDRETRDY